MRSEGTIRILSAVVTTALLYGTVCCSQNAPPQRVASSPADDLQGRTAPNFALSSLDGRTIRLSELHGKLVVLNFWATWCTPCRSEMPWLTRLYKQYRPKGLEVVGIAMNDPDQAGEVAKVTKRMKVRYTIVMGTESVGDAYGGVRSLPQTFLIGRDGKVLKNTAGSRSQKEVEDDIQQLLAADAQGRTSR